MDHYSPLPFSLAISILGGSLSAATCLALDGGALFALLCYSFAGGMTFVLAVLLLSQRQEKLSRRMPCLQIVEQAQPHLAGHL